MWIDAPPSTHSLIRPSPTNPKQRQDSEEYAQKELAKIAEKRRQREAERPLLEQRMAAAEKAKARAEAGAERMRRLWATAVVQQEENAAGDLEGLVMAIPGGREAVVAAFLATVELGPLDASQERWAARLTQEAARGGAGPAGWAAVDIGVQEGEKEVRVIRKQHALLKSKLAELAAAQEEKAAKEAVLSREEDDETQDGEDGGEGEEDGDGPEASALAAGEVALATLEAQLAVKEGSLKASARVLAGAGEGAGGDGHDNEMEEGEESKGRDSVVEGEEMRRRASTEVRKVRFSEPLDNREQTERCVLWLCVVRCRCRCGMVVVAFETPVERPGLL